MATTATGAGSSTRADGKAVAPGQDPRAVPATDRSRGVRADGAAASPEDQAAIAALRKRDSDVRAHERAHQMAAGGLAGGATFSYQRGPDGQLYAIGGEVPISLSPGRTPEETIQRARTVHAAALAPTEPSGPDRAVAAAAASMEAEARAQIGEQARAAVVDRGHAAKTYAERARDRTPGARARSIDLVA